MALSQQHKILVAAGALALLLLLSPSSSSAAEAIIKEFEGLRLKAYQDEGGTWTIGYGSTYNPVTGKPIISTDRIDAPTALKWLQIVNDENRKILDRVVTGFLNNNQVSALLSLMYNIGVGAFRRSTLLTMINAGKPKETVAAWFDNNYITAKGKRSANLVRRRQLEKQLFLS